MAMPTTTRIAAMVAAAAIFFSTFHCVSAQGEAPAPAPLSEGGGGPAPTEGGGVPAPTEVVTAPAPSPLAGCMDSLLNLSDCLTYVINGSNTTKPDTGCCPELAELVKSHPICLCVLLGTNTTQSLPIEIDVKRALKLPSVCGVQTPPVSACSAVGVPVPGPVGSPAASEGPISPEIITGAQTPGGAAVPGNKDQASSIAGSALPIIVGLAIAFLPTFF